jgi:hypothetical protein
MTSIGARMRKIFGVRQRKQFGYYPVEKDSGVARHHALAEALRNVHSIADAKRLLLTTRHGGYIMQRVGAMPIDEAAEHLLDAVSSLRKRHVPGFGAAGLNEAVPTEEMQRQGIPAMFAPDVVATGADAERAGGCGDDDDTVADELAEIEDDEEDWTMKNHVQELTDIIKRGGDETVVAEHILKSASNCGLDEEGFTKRMTEFAAAKHRDVTPAKAFDRLMASNVSVARSYDMVKASLGFPNQFNRSL